MNVIAIEVKKDRLRAEFRTLSNNEILKVATDLQSHEVTLDVFTDSSDGGTHVIMLSCARSGRSVTVNTGVVFTDWQIAAIDHALKLVEGSRTFHLSEVEQDLEFQACF